MTGSHISDGVTTSAGTILTTTSTNVTVNFGSTAGVLNVKANNACGAGANRGLTIGFVCKSAEETFNGSSLELFPNPANEFVDINYKSDFDRRWCIINQRYYGKRNLYTGDQNK